MTWSNPGAHNSLFSGYTKWESTGLAAGISCTCSSWQLQLNRGGVGERMHVAWGTPYLAFALASLSLSFFLCLSSILHTTMKVFTYPAQIFLYICKCAYVCVGASQAACCGACNSYLYSFMRFVITNAARRQCEGPSNEHDSECAACSPWPDLAWPEHHHASNAISLGHKMSTWPRGWMSLKPVCLPVAVAVAVRSCPLHLQLLQSAAS